MAVRFIIGRAGSGKTYQCLEEMTRACKADPMGSPIIYLVPEQASYQAEKSLLQFGHIDGFTRAQVLSFTRLSDYLFAQGGAPRLPRLSSNHRALVVGLILARHRRDADDPFMMSPGLEDALQNLVSESSQYAIDPEKVARVVEKLAEKGSLAQQPVARRLKHKFGRIAQLLEEYRQLIEGRFEDPRDTMTGLIQRILAGDLLQGADIYVDGFLGFTPVEEKVLVALGRKARRLSICILSDPDRGERILNGEKLRRHPIFEGAEEPLRRLYSLFKQNGVNTDKPLAIRAKQLPRFASTALRGIESGLYARNLQAVPKTEDVAFWEAATPREESRKAAEQVLEWHRRHGWGFGEIAILTRELDTYAQPLEISLRNLRIPHFIDRSQPLETHPLVLGIQALLRIALNPRKTENLLALAKSGLLPVERRIADLLENHVLQYPRTVAEWYSEKPWPRHPERSFMDEEDASPTETEFPEEVENARLLIVHTVRPLIERVKSAGDEGLILGDLIDDLVGTIDPFVQSFDPKSDEASILQRIGELFREEMDVAGEEKLPPEVAADLTMRALGGLSLPKIPPMLGRLFVGQVDRSRQPEIKGVIILGLAEGSFPRVSSNTTLLNDSERELLYDAGIDVRPSSGRQFDRETLFAYRAFTASSQAAVFFRPRASNEGTPLPPSTLWAELLRIFPKATIQECGDVFSTDRAWRPRELTAASLRQLDHTHEKSWPTIFYTSDLTFALKSDEVDVVEAAAQWRNEASLSAAAVKEFYQERLSLSASQLESFARCPFQHYAGYMLRPKEILRPELEQRDAGSYCHAVLRNLTMGLRDQNLLGKSIQEGQLLKALNEARRVPYQNAERTGMLASASGQMLMEMLNEALDKMARWLADSFQTLPFHPVDEEASFHSHPNAAFPPWRYTDERNGWRVEVRGQIDRIDIDTEREWTVIVDYKLHEKKLYYPNWDTGESIQLPLYLMVVDRSGKFGRAIGGLYLEIVSKEPEKRKYKGVIKASSVADMIGDNWSDIPYIQGSNGDPFEYPRKWGTPIADQEFEGLLQETEEKVKETARRIVEGHVTVSPTRHGNFTPCTYCAYGSICGIDYRLNRAVVRLPPSREEILRRLGGGT